VSKVYALLPHDWQGWMVMVPGDISRCVILSITPPNEVCVPSWPLELVRSESRDGKNETVQASHLRKLARHCTNAWIRTRNLRFWRPLLCQLSYVDLCRSRDCCPHRLLTPNVKL